MAKKKESEGGECEVGDRVERALDKKTANRDAIDVPKSPSGANANGDPTH
jgi:hypothetical protein